MHPLIVFLLTASLAEGFIVKYTSSDSCPAAYRRFSENHSGCIPRNPSCAFKKIGINGQADIDEILDVHNTLRSKVAMGQESHAGHLPKASNMMQMVWDNELAAIAQRWVENCNYEHDCNECRQVDNFRVGQNILLSKEETTSFTNVINAFYKEVNDYHKSRLSSYLEDTKVTGHFTQVVWAESWRIGCGYARYKSGSEMVHFFACNYGTQGNINNRPVYKQNEPCSECPVNSCCGSSCEDGKNYPGLCKMLDSNVAPVFEDKDNSFFYCNFTTELPDCAVAASGSANWVIKQTLSGNMLSAQLKGGQQGKITLQNSAQIKEASCLTFRYRKNSALAGKSDSSKLEFILERPSGPPAVVSPLAGTKLYFTLVTVPLPPMGNIKVSFRFSVPRDIHDHIADIMDVKVFKGACP